MKNNNARTNIFNVYLDIIEKIVVENDENLSLRIN